MTEDRHLIATAEAARLRGVSPRTIQRWADKGVLPIAARVPGQTGALLFEREDVLHANTGEIPVVTSKQEA